MTSVFIIVISATLTSALLTLVRLLFSKLLFSSGEDGPQGQAPKKQKAIFSILSSPEPKDPYGED